MKKLLLTTLLALSMSLLYAEPIENGQTDFTGSELIANLDRSDESTSPRFVSSQTGTYDQLAFNPSTSNSHMLAMATQQDTGDEDTPGWVTIVSMIASAVLGLLSILINNFKEKYKNESIELKGKAEEIRSKATSVVNGASNLFTELLEAAEDGTVDEAEIKKITKTFNNLKGSLGF